MTPTEICDRYVHAVVRLLPTKEREDVAAELRALLDDALAERAAEAGRPADEGLAVDVLKSFGAPEDMAERYGRPRQYLIGPSYLPAYVITLKVVAAVLIGLTAFSVIWRGADGQVPWTDTLLSFQGTAIGLATTLLVNLGLITLVFAALERVHPLSQSDDWNPLELPQVDDPDRVNRADKMTEIGFEVFLLVLFNAAVGGNSPLFGLSSPPPGFQITQEFGVFIPWINVMFAASIILGVAVLRHGRWSPLLRFGDLILGVYSLVLLLQMLASGDIVASHGISTLLKLGISVICVVTAFETAAQAWRLAESVRARGSGLGAAGVPLA